MANAIRRDQNIKGIKVSDTEIKLSQFADDTTLILDENDETLNSAFSLFENAFCLGKACFREENTRFCVANTRNRDG